MAVLPIIPCQQPPTGQTVFLPGSKSITNRALILAALCQGKVRLQGALFSRDTELMVIALRALGFDIEDNAEERTIVIHGQGGAIPKSDVILNVGNAGTVARFLTAFLCLKPGGTYELDGDPAMRRRPMIGLLDALKQCGAAYYSCHAQPGHFPFTLKTRGFSGGTITVDARESSQILSALLMIAPAAERDTTLVFGPTRPAFVAMTLRLMADSFGLAQALPEPGEPERFIVRGGYPYQAPGGGILAIEPDATAASYFTALPVAVGGSVTLAGYRGEHSIQGDHRFIELLAECDLIRKYREVDAMRISAGPSKTGIEADFSLFSDTFLTLAAIAPLLKTPTHITGIGHTRLQETDRVAGMARELRKLLGEERIVETHDALTIHPDRDRLITSVYTAKEPIAIETYEDHRFAMSFAILGCHDLLGDGEPWLQIKDPNCCRKTFPDFFATLEKGMA